MKTILTIALSEWRYWLRSKLSLYAILLFSVLIVATSIMNTLSINAQNAHRMEHQRTAEKTFLEQPDRHPHRMVHYGHYVFRNATPLSIFDPGLDAITGQAIFLEGHRQNTAMFTQSGESANMGSFAWLTPALMYQLFAPLIIILLGFSALARERETRALPMLLASGLTGSTVIIGKALALCLFTFAMAVPLIINGLIALIYGETLYSIIVLVLAYLSYLFVWVTLCLLTCLLIKQRESVLAILMAFWLAFTLVLPNIAANIASAQKDLPSKIATDLALQEALRKLGDGHNANDPAFKKLKQETLKKYNVEKIEDLPINYRGLVASKSEEKLTNLLNTFSQSRMDTEQQQANILAQFGWLTPTLAINRISRALSGTDLKHYHRFLKEAETARFNFVQDLNKSHINDLNYQDDINRNKGEAGWQKARVSSANWQVLDAFHFKTDTAVQRINNSAYFIAILITWLAILSTCVLGLSRRLQP